MSAHTTLTLQILTLDSQLFLLLLLSLHFLLTYVMLLTSID